MNKREILEKLVEGKITLEDAESLLSNTKIEEINEIIKYDLLREKRTGIPEIVYSENKEPETVIEIAQKVLKKKSAILLSRLTPKHVKAIKELADEYTLDFGTGEKFCLIKHKNYEFEKKGGKVGLITAGTSDIPIAQEAKIVAEMMGCETYMINDVGVAGIHRLFEPLNDLLEKEVDVIIVAAGMEGALPTVVAGLVDVPVVGLPISVGYGYGGKGETALMSMLQSCSLGLAVVNIDAGVNAGAFAAKIALKSQKKGR